jgi:hypothetical protein
LNPVVETVFLRSQNVFVFIRLYLRDSRRL